MNERVIPGDLVAEESLLGAMMLTREAIEQARDAGLRVQDFYKPLHGQIFAAVMALYDRGDPVDAVTVAAEMAKSGSADRAAVMAIMAAAPVAANARPYARIVSEAATVRALLGRAGELTETLYDPSVEFAAKIGAAETLASGADLPLLAGGKSPTLDEYLANTADVPYLIPRTLRRRERLLIVAEPGIGKSTLSRQWGIQLALGEHPFNSFATDVDPLKVLIVDCENDPDGAAEEIEDLLQRAKNSGNVYEPERIGIEFRTEGIDLLARRDYLWLCERLAANKPDLLVIGPLYKLHNVDDNDGGEAKRVVTVLDDLRKRFDVALLLETHAPKECWQIRGDKAQPLHIKGSAVWTQWPEFVYGLAPETNQRACFWYRVRPPRYKRRIWPNRLRRDGKRWPWEAKQADGSEF